MCRRDLLGRWPRAAVAAFLFFTVNNIVAQELPPWLTRTVEQLAEDGMDTESLLEHYERLAERRPCINLLSRRQLEATRLLTLFQVESLLEYRQRYGDILSAAELSLVDGFDREQAGYLARFFSFTSARAPAEQDSLQQWSNKVTVRVRRSFSDTAFAVSARYEGSYRQGLSWGLTADQDAGEPLQRGFIPDFVSAYASWRRPEDGTRRMHLQQCIAGDFTARFGQGLVMWKASPLQMLSQPASIARHPSPIRPHTSLSEADYLRGAAAVVGWGDWSLACFASYRAVDARIVGDSAYTAIYTDGYHRTSTELERRGSMHEAVTGMYLQCEFGRWRVGLSATAYGYDKLNGVRLRDDNRNRQYDGMWGNAGIDVYGSWHQFRFFAEMAVDARASPAALAGAIWSPFYGCDISILGRYYSPGYTATHAGAYSDLSYCANQTGLNLLARWSPKRDMIFSASAAYTYHPGPRYGISEPSDAASFAVAADKTFGKFRAEMQVRGKFTARYPEGGREVESGPFRGRLHLEWKPSPQWKAGMRLTGNPGGYAAFAECTWNSPRGRWEVSGRVTAYNTRDWASRVYVYERDTPQSFGVVCLHGKGAGAYLLLKYAPARWLTMYARISESSVHYFTRIFIPG